VTRSDRAKRRKGDVHTEEVSPPPTDAASGDNEKKT